MGKQANNTEQFNSTGSNSSGFLSMRKIAGDESGQQSLADDFLQDAAELRKQQVFNDKLSINGWKLAFNLAVAGSSIWLYESTSAEAAANNDEIMRYKLIVGASTINFFVTLNNIEPFSEYIASQKIPPELQHYFKNVKSNKAEMALIIVGAVLSAVPLALAVMAKSNEITIEVGSEMGVTFICNGYLHTFPMMLIAQNKIGKKLFLAPLALTVGLPPLLLYGIYRFINREMQSEEVIEQKFLDDYCKKVKGKAHANMVQAINTKSELGLQEIMRQSYSWKWCDLAYQNKLPDDVQAAIKDGALKLLINVANYSTDNPHPWLDWIVGDLIIRNLGGAATIIGHAPYIKDTFDAFAPLDDIYAQSGITFYPIIIFTTLVGYFGGKFFKELLYDGMLKPLFNCRLPQLPENFKRYPKTTLLLISLAAVLARYSNGTALELVDNHFNEAIFDSIRPILKGFAFFGPPIFNFKNASLYILYKAALFAAKFGGDDNQASAYLARFVAAVINDINRVDQQSLTASLKLRSPEEIEALSGYNENDFAQYVELMEASAQQIKDKVADQPSIWQRTITFFCGGSANKGTKPEEEQSLLRNDGYDSIDHNAP